MLLLLVAACSNVSPPEWSGGGTRYASGYAADFNGDDDTGGGGGDDTADTEVDPDAPDLQTASAVYEVDEAEDRYVNVGIAYSDDPDDVDGGTLYYELYADGTLVEDDTRFITTETPFDETQDCGILNGNLVFQVGPVDDGVEHSLEVYVVDYTRNRSNTISIDVTAD